MVSICPLLWQRDVKLQQTNKQTLDLFYFGQSSEDSKRAPASNAISHWSELLGQKVLHLVRNFVVLNQLIANIKENIL